MLRSSRGGIACIEDHVLAAFAEGQLDVKAHEPIEAHLADCVHCRAVLTRAAGVADSHTDGSLAVSPGPADAQELAPGTRVGRYVVEALIGRGAMGAVYAANDPDLNRKVAVKLLAANTLSDAARLRMRARLLREAQAMARLSHPEVITVYDVGALGDQLFVAMEYVDGETLKRWRIAQHRSWKDILAVYERAGSGLAAAHQAGLVHRDFKPDNVLVGRDGRVRVTDFGLARTVDRKDTAAQPRPGESSAVGQESAVTLTRTGALMGTPAYMAPEQLRGGAADARSDVFSFCVALYEAMYGERPFDGSSVPELVTAIDRGAVRAAPVMTRVPAWVRAVLLRGLRAGPDERFSSIRALLDALRSSHAASQGRMRRTLGVVAAALALVGVVVSLARGMQGVALGEAGAVLPVPATRDIAQRAPAPAADLPAPATPFAPNDSATAAAAARPPPPPAAQPTLRSSARPVLHGTARPTTTAPQRAHSGPAVAADRAPPVGNNGALILE